MCIAVLVSVALHAGVVAAYWYTNPEPGPLMAEHDEPLVLNLMPEAPAKESTARQFIDAANPTEPPEQMTPRIAEVDQRASDMNDTDGNDTTPSVDLSRVEQAGRSIQAPPPTPQVPPTPEAPPAEETAEMAEEEEPGDEPLRVSANTPRPMDKVMEALAQPPLQPTPPRPATEAPPEAPRPSADVEREARTVAPVQGEATNLGFLGFEAIQDDLAPYMRIVRNAVEKRWKIAVQMKYNGTDPVDAVLECAIAPNGEIASVQIADPGSSLRFAILCKEAIEKAGPFPPFPFEVPAMYRNEQLRIRWTFSFL